MRWYLSNTKLYAMKLQYASFLTALFVCCTFYSFSQTNDNATVKELIKLKVPPIGLEWEKPVSQKGVLLLNGGLGAAFAFGAKSSGGSYLYYALAPYAGAGYRNYYNIVKRAQDGKNTLNNAANFFALDFTTYFPHIAASKDVEKAKHVSFSLIPTWGMQRSLSRNFNFEWQVGGGVGANPSNGDFYFLPRLGFAFSYLLKK